MPWLVMRVAVFPGVGRAAIGVSGGIRQSASVRNQQHVDDMIAAFRYAISRYGSMSNIPGVVAVRGGGSYVGY
jgi:hypothetical protein